MTQVKENIERERRRLLLLPEMVRTLKVLIFGANDEKGRKAKIYIINPKKRSEEEQKTFRNYFRLAMRDVFEKG